MNNLLFIVTLASLVKFSLGNDLAYEALMGDEELQQPSAADDNFRDCCSRNVVDVECANRMCSLSTIARVSRSTVNFYENS